MTEKELNHLQELLRALAPYVVVCGSVAKGTDRHDEDYASDIDMFVRSRPRDEVDFETCNETYINEICDIINDRNLINSSVGPGCITVEFQRKCPVMLDMSSMFHLPVSNEIFVKDVFGVPMLCCVDDPGVDWELCWDNVEWDDEACDCIIKNPVPKYVA